jgi:hypothetical protein
MQAHLIVPLGTKVVTRAEVRGHDGKVLQPKGSRSARPLW